MADFDVAVRNGTVVTSSWTGPADIYIADGTIAAIAAADCGNAGFTPDRFTAERVIDAEGMLVTPGAVDMHVHLEMDAGELRSTDDFFTGTRAAAFGGTTTVVDFVEPSGGEKLVEAMTARRNGAAARAVVDYGLHMTVGPEQLDKLDEFPLLKQRGIGSYKLYMAYDLRLSDGELLRVLEAVKGVRGLPVVHAENWDIIRELTEENLRKGNVSPEWHPRSRPESFEAEAVGRIIAVADYVGIPIHIFHVSCGEAVEAVTRARNGGKMVTAETCPQYLFLNEGLHARSGAEGALPVCAPPLRPAEENERMWKAIGFGEIQVISSDHCPFTRAQKEAGAARFDTIPGGVPSIELRFPSIYSGGVAAGFITPQKWVEMCCTMPAKLLGLRRKGDIAVGFDADIVLFDPAIERTVTGNLLHEAADWTPYEGLHIRGGAKTVLSRGDVIIEDGECSAGPGRGRFLDTTGRG